MKTTPKPIDLSTNDEETGTLNVIIETPKGSRNKYSYNEENSLFILKGVLPAGASFPFDFGFVPSTKGEDGDPLDVLVLMDEAAYPGVLVPARLIGVIEAEQTEDGKTERNDRLIAVAENSHTHREVKSLNQISGNLIEEIEHFFVSYNTVKGKGFKPLGRFGPERAAQLIEEGTQRLRGKSSGAEKTKRGKKANPKRQRAN